jgi:hypothetical protein
VQKGDKARLNSPLSETIIPDPGFVPQSTFEELFAPTEIPPVVTLVVAVDRHSSIGQAWLFTSTYSGYRRFANVFAPAHDAWTGLLNTVKVVGCGVGMGGGKGQGPYAVTLRDFRIYAHL